jgi:hypothetical protein
MLVAGVCVTSTTGSRSYRLHPACRDPASHNAGLFKMIARYLAGIDQTRDFDQLNPVWFDDQEGVAHALLG